MNWPDTHRHPNPEMILLPHEKARPGVTTAAGEANAREAARLQGDAVRIGLADIERAREQLTERIAMWAVALEGCTSRPAYLHAKMDYLADLVSLLEFLLRTMTSAPRYDRMEAAVIEHQLELTKIELRTVTLTVAKDPVAAEYGRQLAAQAARYEIGGLSAGSGAWQERSAARAGLGMASAEIDALQRKLRLKQLLQAVAMAEDEENKLRSRPRRHTALGAQPQRRATQYDSEKQNLFSDDLLGVLTGAAGRQLRAQINDDPLSAGAGATGRMTAAECVRVLTARSDRLVSATEGALRGEASHLQDDILRRANDLRLTMGMPIIDAPARDEDPWLPSAMASADARSPLHHTTAARAAGVAPSSVLPLSLMGSPLRDPNRPQVILRDANDKAAARTALKDAVDAQLATTLAARLREAQRMGSEGVDVDIIARALSGEGDCVLPNIIAGLGVDGLVEALSPGVQRLQRDAHRHAEKAAAAGERAKWLAALGPALTPDEERELECARSDRDIEYLQALCDARMAALRHAMSPVQAVGIATSMAGVGPGPVTGHAGMRVANPSLAFLPTQGAHVVPSTEATYDAPSVAERVVRMKTQPGGAVDKQEVRRWCCGSGSAHNLCVRLPSTGRTRIPTIHHTHYPCGSPPYATVLMFPYPISIMLSPHPSSPPPPLPRPHPRRLPSSTRSSQSPRQTEASYTRRRLVRAVPLASWREWSQTMTTTRTPTATTPARRPWPRARPPRGGAGPPRRICCAACPQTRGDRHRVHRGAVQTTLSHQTTCWRRQDGTSRVVGMCKRRSTTGPCPALHAGQAAPQADRGTPRPLPQARSGRGWITRLSGDLRRSTRGWPMKMVFTMARPCGPSASRSHVGGWTHPSRPPRRREVGPLTPPSQCETRSGAPARLSRRPV